MLLLCPDSCHNIQVSSGENAPEAAKGDRVLAQRKGKGERERKGKIHKNPGTTVKKYSGRYVINVKEGGNLFLQMDLFCPITLEMV